MKSTRVLPDLDDGSEQLVSLAVSVPEPTKKAPTDRDETCLDVLGRQDRRTSLVNGRATFPVFEQSRHPRLGRSRTQVMGSGLPHLSQQDTRRSFSGAPPGKVSAPLNGPCYHRG